MPNWFDKRIIIIRPLCILLGLCILCGCQNKTSTHFLLKKKQLDYECLNQLEQVFPLPFYEKNSLSCQQQKNQTMITFFIKDSLDQMKTFFLVHADQVGWYLDIEMIFLNSFLFVFKKTKQSVIVLCDTYTNQLLRVQIYFKY